MLREPWMKGRSSNSGLSVKLTGPRVSQKLLGGSWGEGPQAYWKGVPSPEGGSRSKSPDPAIGGESHIGVRVSESFRVGGRNPTSGGPHPQGPHPVSSSAGVTSPLCPRTDGALPSWGVPGHAPRAP